MKRYRLTPAAKIDLAEIHEYIRYDSPRAARRVVTRIREAARRLAEYPGIGHVREDLTDRPFRFWPVYAYLIVYRPESRPLEIVRILHGARDAGRILERVED